MYARLQSVPEWHWHTDSPDTVTCFLEPSSDLSLLCAAGGISIANIAGEGVTLLCILLSRPMV